MPGAGQSQTGLFLVDDHPVLREGIAALVATQPDMQVIGEADTAAAAVAALDSCAPTVAIIDVILPDTSGIELARTIQTRWPEIKIIILSNSRGDEDILRAFETGALAYLFKTSARQDIVSAIRTVSAGRRYLPPEVATALAAAVPRQNLSRRELAVLELMADGRRNKEIAGTLRIAEPTVKEHVRNILSKLHVSDRTAAVVTALRRGFLHNLFLN